MPRVTRIAPYFLVADVVRAAEYYRDKLGFAIRGYFFEDPPVFAMVGRDDQIVMLALMTTGRGGSNRGYKDIALDAYMWVMTSMRSMVSFSKTGPISSGRRYCGFTA